MARARSKRSSHPYSLLSGKESINVLSEEEILVGNLGGTFGNSAKSGLECIKIGAENLCLGLLYWN